MYLYGYNFIGGGTIESGWPLGDTTYEQVASHCINFKNNIYKEGDNYNYQDDLAVFNNYSSHIYARITPPDAPAAETEFDVYGTDRATPVPEPATIFLFIGLFGLAGLARRMGIK